MILKTLIKEQSVRDTIESQETEIKQAFESSFSVNSIYEEIQQNLNMFVSDNVTESFNNIKTYARDSVFSYLYKKSKELSSEV